jgi:hypothetical protein
MPVTDSTLSLSQILQQQQMAYCVLIDGATAVLSGTVATAACSVLNVSSSQPRAITAL